jgi:UDP-glucose 4-epimerase
MGGIKKIIYAASSSCYGEAIVPTKEDALISTLHPYAVSKYLGEQLLFSMANIYSINVASVCIFNAYGRRFKTSGAYGSVIGVFLRQALSGAPLTIVGTGEQTRDFVHVRDVAEAFYLVAEYGKNLNRYNVGSGKSVTINDLARLISKDVKYIPERGGEAQHTLADIKKIRSDTGWEPKTDFIHGCNEMLDNIEEWRDAPLWTENMIMEEVKTWKQYFTGEENV